MDKLFEITISPEEKKRIFFGPILVWHWRVKLKTRYNSRAAASPDSYTIQAFEYYEQLNRRYADSYLYYIFGRAESMDEAKAIADDLVSQIQNWAASLRNKADEQNNSTIKYEL